jgi:hypothetical protein
MRNTVVFLVIGLVVIAAFALTPRSYYSHDHPILNQVRDNFAKLNPEYYNIPLREGDSAYTENKAVITLCLKNPETGGYYDMNTIMYVALHELGHIVSKTHGHNDEFKKNFATLLRQAARKGIYDPRKPIPTTYCGVGPDD